MPDMPLCRRASAAHILHSRLAAPLASATVRDFSSKPQHGTVMPSSRTVCPNCGSRELFETAVPANRGAGGVSLLPGLARLFRRTMISVVVCADCGLTRLFAGVDERSRIVQSPWWRRVEDISELIRSPVNPATRVHVGPLTPHLVLVLRARVPCCNLHDLMRILDSIQPSTRAARRGAAVFLSLSTLAGCHPAPQTAPSVVMAQGTGVV